jgi:hypothetical protein
MTEDLSVKSMSLGWQAMGACEGLELELVARVPHKQPHQLLAFVGPFVHGIGTFGNLVS